jgi:hypothetical protein
VLLKLAPQKVHVMTESIFHSSHHGKVCSQSCLTQKIVSLTSSPLTKPVSLTSSPLIKPVLLPRSLKSFPDITNTSATDSLFRALECDWDTSVGLSPWASPGWTDVWVKSPRYVVGGVWIKSPRYVVGGVWVRCPRYVEGGVWVKCPRYVEGGVWIKSPRYVVGCVWVKSPRYIVGGVWVRCPRYVVGGVRITSPCCRWWRLQ